MSKDTRTRILETSLRVFNARGYANVTLAMLAGEIGIAKGNLWYHFKDKRSLLTALNEMYLERLDMRRQIWPEKGRELHGYALLLKTIEAEIRDYRFMFRDKSDYGAHSDVLEAQLKDIYADVMAQFSAFFKAMHKAGHLTLPNKKIKPLVFNVVMGLRYHLEFLGELGLDTDAGSGAVERGFLQSLVMIEDYLSPAARNFLAKDLRRPAPQLSPDSQLVI